MKKTKEGRLQRIKIIKNFLVNGGVRDRSVIKFYCKEFDIAESTLYRDFEEARQQLFGDNADFKKDFKKTLSSRLEFLYDSTLESRDYKEARQNIVTLAKLWGLNEPDELKLTDNEIKFTFGDAKS